MTTPWTRLLRPKPLVLGAIVASLVCVVIFAMNREAGIDASPATVQRTVEPRRPALTALEEKYIRELWPIHGDVERSTMRMSLGQIFYKSQNLTSAELEIRVKEALAIYQAAESRLSALEVPTSLRSEHEAYISAVRLFQESAMEVRKMFVDRREDHMLVAYPKNQEGSDKIREVGGKFWPHEFPPH